MDSRVALGGLELSELMLLLMVSREEAEILKDAFAAGGSPEGGGGPPRPNCRPCSGKPLLTAARRDINTASESDLERVSVSAPAIESIRAGRPHHSIERAIRGPQISEADRGVIRRVFKVGPLQFTDKTNGRVARLVPDFSLRMGVAGTSEVGSRRDIESAGFVVHTSARGRYVQLSAKSSDAEEVSPSVIGLEAIFPSFKDDTGEVRFLDLRYVMVQLRRQANDGDVESLLSRAGLVSSRRLDERGLLLCRSTSDRHGTEGISNALSIVNESGLVEFAEPAWIGLDDQEPFELVEVDTESVSARAAWNLEQIGLPSDWHAQRGSRDVVLAVVDTGVDVSHPSFTGCVLPESVGEQRRFPASASDAGPGSAGHGTAVAGVLVGNGAMGVWGVAPGCSLLPISVPLTAGLETYAHRRQGLLAVADLARTGRKVVVNLSWKTRGDVLLVRTAISELVRVGAVVVTSAGNYPSEFGQAHYPSDYVETISVGAVDEMRRPAPYTFLGPEIDISAPGGTNEVPLISAGDGGGVVQCRGTSYAAPHVAAAFALLWSRAPAATPAQLRAAIEAAAGPAQPGLGNGQLDVSNALRLLAPLSSDRGAPDSAVDVGPVLSGDELSQLAGRCGLKPLTIRLLRSRTFRSWNEAGALLGMTREDLLCLRSRFERAPDLLSARADEPTDTAATIPADASPSPRTDPVPDLADLWPHCSIKSITLRVLRSRTGFESWTEVAEILGMTPEQVACLMARARMNASTPVALRDSESAGPDNRCH